MRKGLSYSMTIVIVGVILIATAYSVITLSQGGIGSFFEGIGGQQEDRAEAFEIQQACRELKNTVDQEYCSRYMPAYYEGADVASGDWRFTSEGDYNPDAWGAPQCSTDNRPRRVVTSMEIANCTESGPCTGASYRHAYLQTGNQMSCEWTNHYEPVVTVQGAEYNCMDEGYIQTGLCPVE